MAKEPGLAPFLQPEDVLIPHRDGVTTLKLSQAVKDFTDLLCKQGHDPAVSMSRAELVAAAVAHFKLPPAPAVEVFVAQPQPAKQPAQPQGQAKANRVDVEPQTQVPSTPSNSAVAKTAPTAENAPVPTTAAPQPMSRSFAILVLLSSVVELSKGDTDPGSEERIKLVTLANEKYRKLHGL